MSIAPPAALATGVVYCETDFGDIDGKTANGLVRHSEPYRILAVIDSHKAGLDTGLALGNKPSGPTRLPVGAEVRFGLGYGALVRAMTSPFVAQLIVPGTPAASERRIRAPQAV